MCYHWALSEVLDDLGAALWQAGAKQASKRTYSEVLSTAIRLQFHTEALGAMIGIATHLSHEGDHAGALKLTIRVLTDPASSDTVQRSTAAIQSIAYAHLPVDAVLQIEQQSLVQPLTAMLAELLLPDTH